MPSRRPVTAETKGLIGKEKIDRINELARKAKTVGLTQEEIEERAELRQEYLAAFRENFKAQLEMIEIVDEETAIGGTVIEETIITEKKLS